MSDVSSRIDSFFAQCAEILKEEIMNTLSYLGEQCVSRVRDRDQSVSWIDHTTNLRSSIGYSVYEQGRTAIQSAFHGTTEGMTAAQTMLDELASLYAETYALAVVAAMDYASFVEARDNKDVLASTELWARGEIQRYLDMAVKKASNRINNIQV
jgi:hypothetical protein